MNTYEVVFIFNSEKANKYEALAEWFRKDNYLKDTQDFVYVEKKRKDELKFVEGWDEERKAQLAQAEALAESREAEREAERDSEFGPEKDLVLEGISQLNKLANFKPEQQ